MKKLVIPLFIPLLDGEVDYLSLNNIISDIEDTIILIDNNELNNLNNLDLVNVYLYLNLVNKKNKYYIGKKINDSLIDTFCIDSGDYLISSLGNIFYDEIKEYLLNLELKVVDQSLNSYLKLFDEEIKKDERNIIEYILKKKNKIITKKYKNIDNLLGINEI